MWPSITSPYRGALTAALVALAAGWACSSTSAPAPGDPDASRSAESGSSGSGGGDASLREGGDAGPEAESGSEGASDDGGSTDATRLRDTSASDAAAGEGGGESGASDGEVEAGRSCYDDGGPSDAAANSFTAVYAILNQQCMFCHSPGSAGVMNGKLDMSCRAAAYANLVNVEASGGGCVGQKLKRVVPNNAAESVLYAKVTSPTCGARMPFMGTGLSQAETDTIAAWINAGAKND
jgi:hypothetical protein